MGLNLGRRFLQVCCTCLFRDSGREGAGAKQAMISHKGSPGYKSQAKSCKQFEDSVSICIMVSNAPLVKVSHMAKPNLSVTRRSVLFLVGREE